MITFPDRIKQGDTIGITATSTGANLDTIDASILNLNRLGFSTIETNNVRNNKEIVSSNR